MLCLHFIMITFYIFLGDIGLTGGRGNEGTWMSVLTMLVVCTNSILTKINVEIFNICSTNNIVVPMFHTNTQL